MPGEDAERPRPLDLADPPVQGVEVVHRRPPEHCRCGSGCGCGPLPFTAAATSAASFSTARAASRISRCSWASTCPSRPAWWIRSFRSCAARSEEHTSELQSPYDLVCRLLLEKKHYYSANNLDNYSSSLQPLPLLRALNT